MLVRILVFLGNRIPEFCFYIFLWTFQWEQEGVLFKNAHFESLSLIYNSQTILKERWIPWSGENTYFAGTNADQATDIQIDKHTQSGSWSASDKGFLKSRFCRCPIRGVCVPLITLLLNVWGHWWVKLKPTKTILRFCDLWEVIKASVMIKTEVIHNPSARLLQCLLCNFIFAKESTSFSLPSVS